MIHGLKSVTNPMKDGHLIPSLLILLPNKMETTYNKMWDQVKLLCPDARPTHLIVDFEKAAINAFARHYPLTQIKGCFSISPKTFGGKYKNSDYKENTKRTPYLPYK